MCSRLKGGLHQGHDDHFGVGQLGGRVVGVSPMSFVRLLVQLGVYKDIENGQMIFYTQYGC